MKNNNTFSISTEFIFSIILFLFFLIGIFLIKEWRLGMRFIISGAAFLGCGIAYGIVKSIKDDIK